MAHQMNPLIAFFLLILPLTIHRIRLYRLWALMERSEGRSPSLFRFSSQPNKAADGRPFAMNQTFWAIQLSWAALMLIPFHRIF